MIFESTITFVKVDNKGNDKVVKNQFIHESAELFGEVEAKLYEYYGTLADFNVVAIKKSKITEIVNHRVEEGERIFIADLAQYFVDEETEEEKVTMYKMALYANNYDEAYKRILEYLKQGYEGLEVVSLKKTNITDIL